MSNEVEISVVPPPLITPLDAYRLKWFKQQPPYSVSVQQLVVLHVQIGSLADIVVGYSVILSPGMTLASLVDLYAARQKTISAEIKSVLEQNTKRIETDLCMVAHTSVFDYTTDRLGSLNSMQQTAVYVLSRLNRIMELFAFTGLSRSERDCFLPYFSDFESVPITSVPVIEVYDERFDADAKQIAEYQDVGEWQTRKNLPVRAFAVSVYGQRFNSGWIYQRSGEWEDRADEPEIPIRCTPAVCSFMTELPAVLNDPGYKHNQMWNGICQVLGTHPIDSGSVLDEPSINKGSYNILYRRFINENPHRMLVLLTLHQFAMRQWMFNTMFSSQFDLPDMSTCTKQYVKSMNEDEDDELKRNQQKKERLIDTVVPASVVFKRVKLFK